MLDKMLDGVKIINFIYSVIGLQDSLYMKTSIWKDKDIVNAWEYVEKGGVILGSIISLVALTKDEQVEQKIFTNSGIGLIGLTKLIDLLTSKKQNNRVKQKIEFLSLSKFVYDELGVLNKSINDYVTTNITLKKKLDNMKTIFTNSMNSENYELKKQNLLKLSELVDEYKLSLNQIPLYLSSIENFQKKYFYSVYGNSKFENDEKIDLGMGFFNQIKGQITIIRKTYKEDIYPILDVDRSQIIY